MKIMKNNTNLSPGPKPGILNILQVFKKIDILLI